MTWTAAIAKTVDSNAGNIHFDFEHDSQAGNFPLKDPARNCADFMKIRSQALKDTVARCTAITKQSCIVRGVGRGAVMPFVLTEQDAQLDQVDTGSADGTHVDEPKAKPENFFYPFASATSDWYMEKCATPQLAAAGKVDDLDCVDMVPTLTKQGFKKADSELRAIIKLDDSSAVKTKLTKAFHLDKQTLDTYAKCVAAAHELLPKGEDSGVAPLAPGDATREDKSAPRPPH
jgi:hypothetical protein